MSQTQYYFLPDVRHGLAARITLPPAAGAQRAQADLVLRATAYRAEDQQPDPVNISQAVQLYGPGDILGFDGRIVVRTDPRPDTGDFESNCFPAIEFADADFAWRFTPQAADASAPELQPWLALVVLVAEPGAAEFAEGEQSDRNLPRTIRNVSGSALPDLQYAWRWAHAQVTAEEGQTAEQLLGILQNEPGRAVCRLMCPRRLSPKTHYAAFVVPTFKLGLLAGLGRPLGGVDASQPAWTQQEASLELPYYYRWEFGTATVGDFEYLVRLLEPRSLTGLGLRDLDCASPGFGVPGVDRDEALVPPASQCLGLEGALQSLHTVYTPWGRDPTDQSAGPPEPLQKELAALIGALSCHISETQAIHHIDLGALPGGTSVRIEWHTDWEASSRIDYGTTSQYGLSRDDSARKRMHRLILEKLTAGQTYHFRITSQSPLMTARTGDGSFTIPESPIVVPPVYGRWYAGRSGVNSWCQEAWIDVLNLDPRHRAAAGAGAEVVRRQQEALMAAAWEQLGSLAAANELLRRARLGRDGSGGLHRRLATLPDEDFLRATGPLQKRILVEDPVTGNELAAAHYLRTQSCIPAAALDPAFRRILRPRGPIRKRQGAGPSRDLLARLAAGRLAAAGPLPKPAGTTRLADITQRLRATLRGVITLQPSALCFGMVLIGMDATLQARIYNVGTDELTVRNIAVDPATSSYFSFSLPSTPFTLKLRQSAVIAVTYRPKEARTDTGALLIDSDDQAHPSVRLEIVGNGAWPMPNIQIDPAGLDFRTVNVGSTRSESTTIRNIGSADLHVTGIDRAQGTTTEYMFQVPSFTLTPGAAAVLTVTYRPTDVGTDAGALLIYSDDPDQPQAPLNLVGTGAQAHIQLTPESLDFGNVTVDTSRDGEIWIQNIGNADLHVTISREQGTSVEYSFQPSAFALAPGAETVLRVTYRPTDVGTDVAALLIISSDPGVQAARLSLAGRGEPVQIPQIGFTPSPVVFGEVQISTSSAVTVTITNDGTAELWVDSVTVSGIGFSCPDPPPRFSLALHEWRSVQVIFAPEVEGDALGWLIVASNDPKTPSAWVQLNGTGTNNPVHPTGPIVLARSDDPGLRFSDGSITCEQITNALNTCQPFALIWSDDDAARVAQKVCAALTDWLDKPGEAGAVQPPVQVPGFIEAIREMLLPALEPRRTVVERTQKRLNLDDDRARRGKAGVPGDPLADFTAAPSFAQPMYEGLRDLGQDWLLPGVEKVAQNTIGVLSTNRRFVEAYLCGCNHAFASELLWRGYPTGPRGSYFRQFWDVGDSAEAETEELKDIAPMASWGDTHLGGNGVRPVEGLALVIRGELLKRYPDALIYAIDAVPGPGGEPVPGLPEYRADQLKGRVWPLWRATLPPDLTFLGFPFDAGYARDGGSCGLGMFVVVEERVGEARFGLDAPEEGQSSPPDSWENVSWGHFGLGDKQHVGLYLDQASVAPPTPTNSEGRVWNEGTSAAARAWITMRVPVRIAVHALQLIPESA